MASGQLTLSPGPNSILTSRKATAAVKARAEDASEVSAGLPDRQAPSKARQDSQARVECLQKVHRPAIHVFDSEASAQALLAQVESAPAGAVTADSVEVGQVMAHA